MNLPLWRIALHVLFIAFAAQHAIGAYMLFEAGEHRGLVLGNVLQAVLALWVAITMLWRRFEIGALVALGIFVVATTLLAGVVGNVAGPIAIGQGIITVFALAGLGYMLKHDPDERPRQRPR